MAMKTLGLTHSSQMRPSQEEETRKSAVWKTMAHTLLLYCLVFLLPTESCRTLYQAASKSKEKVPARPYGVCDGVCTDNSQCTQPCPPDTQGNMRFSCRKKTWHKITDTCRTLNAVNIFEEDSHLVQPFEDNIKISVYTGKSETISDMLLQKCPTDLSCVIRGIQQSPRIPGNIAIIVQLLHNISTALWTGVDEEKMRHHSQPHS